MADITLSNIKAYLTGNFRYEIYDTKLKFLIPLHIRQQIAFRVKVMDKECYNQGSCIICGCKTTALQMSNKACDKPCYPTMMDRTEWKIFKGGGTFYDRKLKIFWKIREERLIKFKDYIDYVGQCT
jgi:hypothetical protein